MFCTGWILAGVLWTASDAKPVMVENLKSYEPVYLAVQRDTLRNCDSTSAYRLILRDKKIPNNSDLPKGADAFTANREPVLQFKFLNASQDSVFFMASIADSIGQTHYTSLCLERKDIMQAYTVPSADSESSTPRGNGSHRGGGHHRGGGMGGGTGGGTGGY